MNLAWRIRPTGCCSRSLLESEPHDSQAIPPRLSPAHVQAPGAEQRQQDPLPSQTRVHAGEHLYQPRRLPGLPDVRTREEAELNTTTITTWAALWNSEHKPYGFLICRERNPVLFKTRAEARKWIQSEYGYIKTRTDLRDPPHGWRMPRPVRVTVALQGERKQGAA